MLRCKPSERKEDTTNDLKARVFGSWFDGKNNSLELRKDQDQKEQMTRADKMFRVQREENRGVSYNVTRTLKRT